MASHPTGTGTRIGKTIVKKSFQKCVAEKRALGVKNPSAMCRNRK